MSDARPMKELLEPIVRALVDHPDRVRISMVDGEKTCVLELRCHPDDVGKVIGKGGKTIGAIRALLSAIAHRSGRRALIEVVQ